MKGIIPIRPDNFVSPLNQQEQTALSWLIISGCTKKEAFFTFVRPDMSASSAKAAVEDFVKQFFARKEVKDYIDAYRNTLESFLKPKPKEEKKESLDDRKAKAKAKLVEFAMSLADNIEQADDPEFVLKIADKCNLLDGDEEVEEKPRRYLPVPCSACAYRMFCEENTEDMCQYCKYHHFGEENGIHFEKTEILDIPQNND